MASSELFTAKPKSIKKATLSPTDRTIFSTKPSLFNFRMKRKRKPGIKVRKIKPEICLKTGISRSTARTVDRSTSARSKKKPLASRLLAVLVISLPDG